MKPAAVLAWVAAFGAVRALAVYAPIPEEEQGQGLSVRIDAGVVHDSNIFGSARNEIDSLVYRVAPQLSFNASLSPRTFFSARYQPSLEHMVDRPGDRTLDSHDASVRLAHAFRPDTTIDLNETFQIVRNPESLLAGVPVNTDQSFKRNIVDGRFETKVNPRLAGLLKARALHYRYDNRGLADGLDRAEVLVGAAAAYSLLPELKAAAEARYLDVAYDVDAAFKDKSSRYLLVGVDYEPNPKLAAGARIGWEGRRRRGDDSTDSLYAEATVKYDYGQSSYVAGGYGYGLEETSNLSLYTDARVHRLFVNVQHFLTPVLSASTSLNFEPGQLQGRRGISPDRDEDTVRAGFALTYAWRRNGSVSLTYDRDRVSSDDDDRDLRRNRVGFSARFEF